MNAAEVVISEPKGNGSQISEEMKTIYKSYSCIAQSVDLRPSMLYIDSFDENSAIVKPHEGWYDRPLNVPRSILFRTDGRLFNRLVRAYEKKDEATLRKLWSEAEPWMPS